MVLEYLEKLESSFLAERNLCEEELNELELQMKENQRFIAILEESDDLYYEAFSPRQVNLYQKKKIKSLREEQREIAVKINEYKEMLSKKEDKLSELREVLEFERQRVKQK